MIGLGARSVVTCAIVLSIAPAAIADTTSQTFTSTGAEQVFTVPAAVTSMNVLLVGANGASIAGGASGGTPSTVQGTLAVTPSEKLFVEVGGDGGPPTVDGNGLGGFNGGGGGGEVFGGFFSAVPSAGGGGGGSDIRTCSASDMTCITLASRLIAAGGGGGAGGRSAFVDGGSGAAADTPIGSGNNGKSYLSDPGGIAGGRATATSGGAAGTPGGTAGGLGTGGAGGFGGFAPGGGGGGGGLYGGGGGGSGSTDTGSPPTTASGGAGGGGGSSGVPLAAQGVTSYSLVPTDNNPEPHITLTWTLPPPAAVTGQASAVTSTSATVNGTVNPDNSALSSCSFGISPTPPAGATVSCAQQVPNGGVPVPVSAQLLGLKPSTTYTITLSATNIAGPASGSPASFTTSAPVPPPVISKLRVARRVHRLAGKHARARKTIRLTLSEPAKLTFTFGRKRHKKFVAVRGTLTATGTAGANKIKFGGVLGRKRLRLGSYTLTVVATNAVGGKSKPAHARFKLIR